MTLTIPARPTTYNGIPMRSRMEARVAAFLDFLGYRWTYEPRAYASTAGQYLPDFVIQQPGYRPVFVEVKGSISDDDAEALLRRMQETIYPSEPGAMLFLVDAVALESGYWQAAWGGRSSWLPFTFMRCPDHPRVTNVALSSAGMVSPWCRECDPTNEVTVPTEEALAYVITEADAVPLPKALGGKPA